MSDPKKWYEIKNAAADQAEIWLYEEIGAWGIGAKQFIDDLKQITAKKISLRINSPGGDVFDGVAIHNAIKRHPAKCTTYIDGLAASIASVIALAGDKVVAAENAMFMIHDPWGFTAGTSDDMRHYADVLDKVRDSILTSYCSKTGMDEESCKKMMADETWMTAQEAFDHGFVDLVEGRMEMQANASFRPALEKLNVKNIPEQFRALSVPAPAAAEPQPMAAEPAEPQEPAMTQPAAAPAAGATVVQNNDAAAIAALCTKHNMADKIVGYITANTPLAEVQGQILDAMASQPVAPAAAPAHVQMNTSEAKAYSYSGAIRAALDVREGRKPSGIEAEISQELRAGMPKTYQDKGGIFIPLNTSLTTTGSGTGAEVVRTQYGDLIEMLRNMSVVNQMGAQTLNGLTGPLTFPKQTSASTLYWTGEAPGSATTESNIGLGTVTLSPKTAMAVGSLSRNLILMGTPNAEQMVRTDLATVAALGVDRAALHGAGSSNEPDGLYHLAGVNAKAMGGVPTFGKLVDMGTECAIDNALMGNLGYVTTPGMSGKLMQTLVASAAGSKMIWEGNHINGQVCGYKAMASNQLSSTLVGGAEHGLIFGNWSDMIVGFWGGIEITVDPYTLADKGLIKLVMFLMADIVVRHPESFCKATGATIV